MRPYLKKPPGVSQGVWISFKVARILLVLAFMWAFVGSLSFYNRVYILRNIDDYKAAEFIVSKVCHDKGDSDSGQSSWAEGTVNGHAERLGLSSSGPAEASPGIAIPVWYNANATTMMIQGETLRVLPRKGSALASEESREAWHLGRMFFSPLLVCLFAVAALWRAKRKQERASGVIPQSRSQMLKEAFTRAQELTAKQNDIQARTALHETYRAMGGSMRVQCPKCGQPIRPKDINVGKGIAFCEPCEELFSLGGVAEGESAEPVAVARPDDTGVVLQRDRDRLVAVMPRGAARGAAWFMLFFTLFWNALSWTFFIVTLRGLLAGQSAFEGAFNGFGVLFLIPFLLIGVLTAGLALYLFFGQVSLAMDRENLLLERRLGRWAWKKTFALSDIKQINLAVAYSQNDVPVYGVGIHLENRRMPATFGSNLSDEEKAWLIYELTAFWRESQAQEPVTRTM